MVKKPEFRKISVYMCDFTTFINIKLIVILTKLIMLIYPNLMINILLLNLLFDSYKFKSFYKNIIDVKDFLNFPVVLNKL